MSSEGLDAMTGEFPRIKRSQRMARCSWLVAEATTCLAIAAVICTSLGCRNEDTALPVATPSFKANLTRAPQGSPIDVTYRFLVAPNAAPFAKNYRVMVHVLDSDEELMWTDDHDPPTPARQWKPGQLIEYTRTIFIPVYPYLGMARIEMGLYSTDSQERLPLTGDDTGQRAYRVGSLELLPQTDNIFVIFKDGWHSPETPENDPAGEWQWTKKNATLSMRNPKRDVLFYLHADQPSSYLPAPQRVTVTLGAQQVDDFVLQPKIEVIRKVLLTAAQLGSADTTEITLHVDTTFVPSAMAPGQTKDPRELGIRVFHAFIQPR